jgi:uncharacterized protein (DUF2249 family)
MTTVSQDPPYGLLRASAAAAGRLPVTLADEHAVLLAQVAVRAGDALAALAVGRWPAGELRALVGYVRAEVLRQAADEERLLFPGRGAAAGMTRLARDHARLRAATEVLESAAAGGRPASPVQLATAIRDFLFQLERHLGAEEALLAASGELGGVTAPIALGGYPHEWYPLTEGPVIDLDSLPLAQAVDATVQRLLRLRGGERVELESGNDPYPVWQRLRELGHGGYSFVYLDEGPDHWRVRVSLRAAA